MLRGVVVAVGICTGEGSGFGLRGFRLESGFLNISTKAPTTHTTLSSVIMVNTFQMKFMALWMGRSSK
jgi:hypothetical protein